MNVIRIDCLTDGCAGQWIYSVGEDQDGAPEVDLLLKRTCAPLHDAAHMQRVYQRDEADGAVFAVRYERVRRP